MKNATLVLIFSNVFLTVSLFCVKIKTAKPHVESRAGAETSYFANNAGIDPIYFDYQKI